MKKAGYFLLGMCDYAVYRLGIFMKKVFFGLFLAGAVFSKFLIEAFISAGLFLEYLVGIIRGIAEAVAAGEERAASCPKCDRSYLEAKKRGPFFLADGWQWCRCTCKCGQKYMATLPLHGASLML
jgi:hypothetical protein